MRKFFHCIKFILLLAVCLPLLFYVEKGVLQSLLIFINAASVFALVLIMLIPDKKII